jgi:hypothetical protein
MQNPEIVEIQTELPEESPIVEKIPQSTPAPKSRDMAALKG